jgi:hypothetical protein
MSGAAEHSIAQYQKKNERESAIPIKGPVTIIAKTIAIASFNF